MSDRLRAALADVIARDEPGRIPDDLWLRGRRRRRQILAIQAGAVALLVLLVGALGPATQRLLTLPPAAPSPPAADAVPARVFRPWPLQAGITDAPPGPATVVFQTGSDAFGGVVVGHDGSYRLFTVPAGSTFNEMRGWTRPDERLGVDTLISPDGRYLAGLDGVVDLRTGHTAVMNGDDKGPLAWSPDGTLLVNRFIPPALRLYRPARVRNGMLTDPILFAPEGRAGLIEAAAFSPDGRRTVLATADSLRVVDAANGSLVWTRDISASVRLAGPAGFTPDGRRIAILQYSSPCERWCPSGPVLRYLDAATGTLLDDPGVTLPGDSPRVLGWRPTGEVIVATSASATDRHASVLLIGADGHRTVAVETPDAVRAIDIPRSLVEHGRFGAASHRPVPWPVAPVLYWLLAIALAGILCAFRYPLRELFWRRVRRRSPSPLRTSRLTR